MTWGALNKASAYAQCKLVMNAVTLCGHLSQSMGEVSEGATIRGARTETLRYDLAQIKAALEEVEALIEQAVEAAAESEGV